MGLTFFGHVKTVKHILEQLEASSIPEAQAASRVELRASVKQYEARYGMSSDRIHDAIDVGELIEDRDVGHWIFQYDLLRDVEKE